MVNPKTEALAFRIWAYASPLGWDCTINEIADELGENRQRVNAVCRLKAWSGRLRHMSTDTNNYFQASLRLRQPGRFSSYANAVAYSGDLL